MKLERGMFRSLVARRMTLLFGLCAITPILVLGVLSYRHVNTQLSEQSRQRLLHTAKSLGMSMYGRLVAIEDDLEIIASVLSSVDDSDPPHALSEEYGSLLTKNSLGLQIQYSDGESVQVFGQNLDFPNMLFAADQQDFIGESFVLTRTQNTQAPRVFMAIPFPEEHGKNGLLVSELHGPYLWFTDSEVSLSGNIELHVLDQDKNIIFTSSEGSPPFQEDNFRTEGRQNYGWFSWSSGDEEYLACFRDLFMESRFYASTWTIVVSESKSYVNAPAAYFKQIYPPILIGSLLVVILLSSTQIRRSLVPLEKLKTGAEKIARKDFETRVEVSSNDEFASVAGAFNAMAIELGRQFKSLGMRAEIDRTILGTVESSKIAKTLVKDLHHIHPCQAVCMAFVNEDTRSVECYFSQDPPSHDIAREESLLTPVDEERLRSAPAGLTLTSHESVPEFLEPLVKQGMSAFHVYPISLDHRLAGIVSLGYKGLPQDFHEIEVPRLTQLIDQVRVALSNSRLVRELESFQWGTLTSLARAIDAKSHWTAGHSENVARLSHKIGDVLGLDEKELDLLQRGALLHDIGKLGIPNSILDKAAKLTHEEYETLQTHPYLGAQILEPISSFADVIDIVLQHHENFDGSGYPNRISRDAISLYSRIVSIADRYDAMTSDRPYRMAHPPHKAVRLIVQQSERWFDPKVLEAFLSVVSRNRHVSEISVERPSLDLNRMRTPSSSRIKRI